MTTLWKLEGKRTDGIPIAVLMRDWDDRRPAQDANGLWYEAYQTEWHVGGKVYFVAVSIEVVLRCKSASEFVRFRQMADCDFLAAMGIDHSSLDFKGKTMALIGQDGETHSHLRPEHAGDARRLPGGARQAANAALPATGHWVGPRIGDPVPLEKAESTLPSTQAPSALKNEPSSILPGKVTGRLVYPASDPRELQHVRGIIHQGIQHLLEHQPMVESQRRILVQALGVLETFA